MRLWVLLVKLQDRKLQDRKTLSGNGSTRSWTPYQHRAAFALTAAAR